MCLTSICVSMHKGAAFAYWHNRLCRCDVPPNNIDPMAQKSSMSSSYGEPITHAMRSVGLLSSTKCKL